ncbi:MAG: diaminopimelate decarboxylase [Enterococcus sp.]
MTELELGGIPASALANEYGTPLYVYDEEQIIETLKKFKSNFYSEKFATQILYASKAFQTIELIQLMAEYAIGLDVVSGGELYTALQTTMPVEEIYFHGNNKSYAEIIEAIESGVTHFIADNEQEVALLARISEERKSPLQLLLRLNVGIEAHTHEYILTTHVDSKFGLAYQSEAYQQAYTTIEKSEYLIFEGFHAHIGSQIFEMDAWYAALDRLFDYLLDFSSPLVINIGGGFGIAYTENDQPLPIESVLANLITYTEKQVSQKNILLRKLMIEPGRSMIAQAGTTLYRIGFTKETPHKHYYFVDGGMTDNIRPALYQAEYTADIATKLTEPKKPNITVAGKMCESGDVLISSIALPEAQMGDILAIYATGAYGYSMSSNYNRALRPAVVFVNEGQSRVVVRRQTYSDLLGGEVAYGNTNL